MKSGGIPLSAYLELHIEQGPCLDAEQKTIGVVTAAQGLRWFELKITGRDAHSGTTPMSRRADALVACARLIVKVEQIALARAPSAVATVGRVVLKPNSPNVVPGEVCMTVDLRDPHDTVIDSMEAELQAAISEVRRTEGVAVTIEKIADNPAVQFHPDCVDAVRAAAAGLAFAHRDIISGAGHDAVNLARVTRSGMIFVPCKDGLSHNEAESATLEDCAAGAQVLLEAALALDAKLSTQ
jgi:N-carbamoyl-L-amino-acid hydrolase